MKQIAWIFILAAACTSGAFAQTGNVVFQSAGGIVTARAIGGGPLAPVTGAPYSATMTTKWFKLSRMARILPRRLPEP